jgi:glycosyltransferase involved in cell wall biosynthesis
MCWFYDQMQTVYAPSDFYRQHLVEGGFDPRKVLVLKRGVDVARFSPEKRRPVFWNAYGLRAPFVFAYVGRVSKEKNLDHLLESFLRLKAAGAVADLAVVGDGPQLPALRARYERPGIAFTGFLGGDDLAHAYASADAFVFPSTTDTFGNAVLEAQASGLPAIVSDQGGPAEVIHHERTGLVFSATEADGLLNAMQRLLADRALCQRLGAAAIESARTSSWEQVLDDLWNRQPRLDAMLGNSSLHRIRAVGAAGLANLEVA